MKNAQISIGTAIEVAHTSSKGTYHAIWIATKQKTPNRRRIPNWAKDMHYDVVVLFSSEMPWRKDNLTLAETLDVVEIYDNDFIQKNYPEYLI